MRWRRQAALPEAEVEGRRPVQETRRSISARAAGGLGDVDHVGDGGRPPSCTRSVSVRTRRPPRRASTSLRTALNRRSEDTTGLSDDTVLGRGASGDASREGLRRAVAPCGRDQLRVTRTKSPRWPKDGSLRRGSVGLRRGPGMSPLEASTAAELWSSVISAHSACWAPLSRRFFPELVPGTIAYRTAVAYSAGA
jgi:hypothetical protein